MLQVFEPMLSEVSQGNPCHKLPPDHLLSRERDKSLTAMSYSSQPGTAIDGRDIVVSVAQVGLAGMQCHAYPQRCRRRPGLGMQRLLERGCSGDRIARARKHGKPAVALAARTHDVAGVLRDDLLDQRIMAHE